MLAIDKTYINQKNGWQIVEVLEIWANGEREREREYLRYKYIKENNETKPIWIAYLYNNLLIIINIWPIVVI
jgi:hypothetical protein